MTAWSVCFKPSPAARLNLVCFSYAGGGPNTYRTFPAHLPPEIEVHAVQLPGRAARLTEPTLSSIDTIADAVVPALAPLWTRPFAFFGHSMGAVVAFEVARRMRAKGPVHLFASARVAPHRPHPRAPIHALPDRAFVDALRAMQGTPEEVLRDPELMALVAPALRADFKAIESYRCMSAEPLSCRISAFGGDADPDVTVDDLLAWQDHARDLVLVETVSGGHFYIDRDPAPVLRTVAQDLAPWLR